MDSFEVSRLEIMLAFISTFMLGMVAGMVLEAAMHNVDWHRVEIFIRSLIRI